MFCHGVAGPPGLKFNQSEVVTVTTIASGHVLSSDCAASALALIDWQFVEGVCGIVLLARLGGPHPTSDAMESLHSAPGHVICRVMQLMACQCYAHTYLSGSGGPWKLNILTNRARNSYSVGPMASHPLSAYAGRVISKMSLS